MKEPTWIGYYKTKIGGTEWRWTSDTDATFTSWQVTNKDDDCKHQMCAVFDFEALNGRLVKGWKYASCFDIARCMCQENLPQSDALDDDTIATLSSIKKN